MNALGFWLLGSIAHATIFAVAGIAAYLAIRRLGPAAGSLAAGSSLVVMALVSAVALSPWPRWWTWSIDRPEARAAAAPVAAGTSSVASEEGRPPVETPTRPKVDPSPARPTFLSLLVDELKRPAAASASLAWGWREWLAAGLLASALLGLARLGAGLFEVERLRTRSYLVDDPGLDDLLQVLRAELSCTRPVTLRESSDLTTPATIGWRRPVLLLPFDWRDWDEDERRAVLAHELAHVRRGDFAAGVAAQLALALHFYHPLAHWLAARLRLEQELAADAWGARLSGDKTSYLETLARMALRRDGRAVTWPARAFLPSHGTFVRRIEMLKNHGPIRHLTLPLAARASTVAMLVAIGLLVAGLRGPAGGSAAMAQEQPAAERAADADSYQLAYLPADTRMMLVLRPQSLLRRRDVQSLLGSLRDNPMLLGGMPFNLEDVGQQIVFWDTESQAGPARFPNPLALSGFVLQMTKPQDWKALMAHLGGPGLNESRHEGQTYYRSDGGGAVSWAFYTPNDRTIVMAREVVLREIIADRSAPAARHSWDDAWQKVGKGQVMLAVDTRWLRREIARVTAGPGGAAEKLAIFSPLYEKAQAHVLSVNATDRSLAVDLVSAVQGPENAKAVAETLQAVVTLGKNALPGIRRDVEQQRMAGEAPLWALEAAESVVQKAKVETTEGFVRLHAESAVDLAEGMRLVAPAVVKAKADANRYQSVNNLKQIGLAFHNFASVTKNTHFPASANRDKGKFPYSWRVAILPYIEHQELYNQYNFDEPWDGPNNRKLIDKMPAVYAYPGPDGRPTSRSHTTYFVFTGPRTIGGDEDGTQLAEITDGTSNTILAVEAKREVPWTKPEDIPVDPDGPPPELGGFTPDGFNALFADGSVRYIKKTVAPQVLKALITRDGGEVISSDSF